MARRYQPPAETVAAARGAPLWRVGVAIVFCAGAATLFGADALLEWAEKLPIHPVSDWLVEQAVGWRDLTRAVGLGDAGAALRRAVRSLQNYRG